MKRLPSNLSLSVEGTLKERIEETALFVPQLSKRKSMAG
jgi:hypothetical protein